MTRWEDEQEVPVAGLTRWVGVLVLSCTLCSVGLADEEAGVASGPRTLGAGMDHYALAAGQTWWIEVSFDASMADIDLVITNEEGVILAMADSTSSPEALVITLTEPAMLHIYQLDPSGTVEYELSIQPADQACGK